MLHYSLGVHGLELPTVPQARLASVKEHQGATNQRLRTAAINYTYLHWLPIIDNYNVILNKQMVLH